MYNSNCIFIYLFLYIVFYKWINMLHILCKLIHKIKKINIISEYVLDVINVDKKTLLTQKIDGIF